MHNVNSLEYGAAAELLALLLSQAPGSPENLSLDENISGDTKAKILAGSAYWVAKSFSGTAHEKNCSAVWRMQYQGTRTVVCAPFLALERFMGEEGVPEEARDVSAVWQYPPVGSPANATRFKVVFCYLKAVTLKVFCQMRWLRSLEARGCKLEARGSRLDGGGWRLEAGSWRLEA